MQVFWPQIKQYHFLIIEEKHSFLGVTSFSILITSTKNNQVPIIPTATKTHWHLAKINKK